MNNSKSWWESRTLWFNIILTVVFTADLISETYVSSAPILGIIAGVGNFILRLDTSTKIEP